MHLLIFYWPHGLSLWEKKKKQKTNSCQHKIRLQCGSPMPPGISSLDHNVFAKEIERSGHLLALA